MTLLVPNGEKIRTALAFVLECRAASSASLSRLCDEAGLRFDLSPLEVQALEHALSRSDADEKNGTAQGGRVPSEHIEAGAANSC